MNGITCVLLATGKIDRLQESLASFLSQELAEKQLIIVNLCVRMKLEFAHPDVIIINTRQAPMGGRTMPFRAKNMAIEQARYPTIVIWSELDYYLPNHLSRVADNMDAQWLWFEKEFQSDGRKHLKVNQGSESVFAFTKEAWSKVGGFGHGINGAEDRNFVARITKECTGRKLETPASAITFVRLGSDGERGLITASIRSGAIKLEAVSTRDMRSQIGEFMGVKKRNKVCFVLLGRFGDIINILPVLHIVAKRYGQPFLCVSEQFVSLLEGVSYVSPYVVRLDNAELGTAISMAREEFEIVVNAQIWGRGWQQKKTVASYNMESWKNCGMLSAFKEDFYPLFDRRSSSREDALLAKYGNGRPMILVNTSKAVSSPCEHCAPLYEEIKARWLDYNVVDLSQVHAERIYDLLVLMEAAKCLVSIDTSHLHLAVATAVPTVALTNPKEWAGTIVRGNLVSTITYDEVKKSTAAVHESIAAAIQRKGGPIKSRTIKPNEVGKVFHVVDRFEDTDPVAVSRKRYAMKSWDDLYATGQLIPVHVWKYPRNARDEMGDPRPLPYLKDLLKSAMDVAGKNDLILWSNDDTILHPQIVEYIRFHCSVYGACSFFRTEFNSKPPATEMSPEAFARHGRGQHIGRDAFAFHAGWLKSNWSHIPDAVLGASDWDLHLAAFIRRTNEIVTTGSNLGEVMFPAEAPTGYVGHVAHASKWNTHDVNKVPSNVHNRKLFKDWASRQAPDLKFTAENTLATA
jgi:hypothetical protein